MMFSATPVNGSISPERLEEFRARVKEIESTTSDPDALSVASKKYVEEASSTPTAYESYCESSHAVNEF